MTHIVVGLNDEDGGVWTHADEPGSAAGNSSVFDADVPDALWERCEDAYKTWRGAEDLVVQAAGFDPAEGRMLAPCSEYVGEMQEAVAHPGRWIVFLPAHPDPDVWPRIDVELGIFDEQEACAEALVGLPEQFLLAPTAAVGVNVGRWINRDDLRAEYRPGWSRDAWWETCDRCGWGHDSHTERTD